MQAVQTRRYALTGTAIALVLAAILLIGALAIMSARSAGDSASGLTAPVVSVPQFDQISFLELNTLQIPYSAPRVLSFEESAFLEANIFQTPYGAPALSHQDITFWEANTLQTPYTALAPVYTGTLPEE